MFFSWKVQNWIGKSLPAQVEMNINNTEGLRGWTLKIDFWELWYMRLHKDI